MTGRPWHGVTFLSDFGLADEFVGVCHGVILRLAPQAHIVDVTHGIRRGDIAHGALVLSQAVAYLPSGVHLAVVDPGVGSERRGVVITTTEGSALVGPDNGLLPPAAARLGGVVAVHSLENPDLMAPRPSRTFHGRDIFAPAAGHLLAGVPPEAFGPRVADLIPGDLPVAQADGRAWQGVVTGVDRFGNLQTNLPPPTRPDGLLDVTLSGVRHRIPVGVTYSTVAAGQAVVLEDSHGTLAVCVNGGSAAERFAAAAGSQIQVAPVSAP